MLEKEYSFYKLDKNTAKKNYTEDIITFTTYKFYLCSVGKKFRSESIDACLIFEAFRSMYLPSFYVSGQTF